MGGPGTTLDCGHGMACLPVIGMEPILDSLGDPTATALIVTIAAVIVVLGGVFAIIQSFRKPTYDAAIAYGVGGMFACIFLLGLGHIAYVFDMGMAQEAISNAPYVQRPVMLAEIERSAMASIYIAFAGVIVALPMAIFLFLRALVLRKRTPGSDTTADVRPRSVADFDRTSWAG